MSSTLAFCDLCGTLLPSHVPDTCPTCTAKQPPPGPPKPIVTESSDAAFPSSLRARRSAVQVLKAGDVQTEATIEQQCPQCGNHEMKFYTLQLRSADEGATVFYRCDKCGYRFNTNN